MKKFKAHIFSAVFLFCIMFAFLSNIITIIKGTVYNYNDCIAKGLNVSETVKTSSIRLLNDLKEIDNSFIYKPYFIDIYGLAQKVLQRRSFEDYTIFLADNERLVIPDKKRSEELIQGDCFNLYTLFSYSQQNNIDFLYVAAPSEFKESENILPYGIKDYSNENLNQFMNIIKKEGITSLDLRREKRISEISSKDLYYKTDHHWSLLTSFNSFACVVSTINQKFNYNLDPNGYYTNLENYKVETIPESFSGSRGIKLGRFIGKPEEFTIFYPNFTTSLEYSHKINNKEILNKSGDFKGAFIDESILLNHKYNNKYNAFLNGGYVENKITNNNADNNLKALLISNSFGRPFTQYFSLCFKETVYLDPQQGRYNENYLAYIDQYKPDIIVVVFDKYVQVNVN